MQSSGLSKKLTGAALAIALCASPTMAAAAPLAVPAPAPTVSPLVAISLYGTQASAQEVCANAATAAAAAGAAVAAQGRAGCVLPATDAPPPPPAAEAVLPPPVGATNFGVNPILAALAGLALLAGIIAAVTDDDDDERERVPVTPG